MKVMSLCLLIIAGAIGYFGIYMPRQVKEKALSQMAEVTRALDLYYQDCKVFPEVAKGLRALVEKPETCPNWQGPYLAENHLNDVWGRPYLYQREEEFYSLKSLGADGQPGGDSANADLPEESE